MEPNYYDPQHFNPQAYNPPPIGDAGFYMLMAMITFGFGFAALLYAHTLKEDRLGGFRGRGDHGLIQSWQEKASRIFGLLSIIAAVVFAVLMFSNWGGG